MNPPSPAAGVWADGCNRTPSAHSVKEVVTRTEAVLMARQMADHTSKLMCREGVAEGTMACLGGDEPRFVRDLGGLASRAYSWLPGYDGVCDRPARASGIFRNAPAVRYQTDVLLSCCLQWAVSCESVQRCWLIKTLFVLHGPCFPRRQFARWLPSPSLHSISSLRLPATLPLTAAQPLGGPG